MSEKRQYSDKIEYVVNRIDLKAYHEDSENGVSFLKIDCEEHPDLTEDDLEPLGQILLNRIDNYIRDQKDSNFKIERHSSSYHVLYRGDEIAKVWHGKHHDSQIKNEKGALRVAEELVRILSDKSECLRMPKLKRDSVGQTPHQIVNGCTILATFRYE